MCLVHACCSQLSSFVNKTENISITTSFFIANTFSATTFYLLKPDISKSSSSLTINMSPKRSCQTKQNPQTAIIVETYKSSKLASQPHILSLDQALENHHFFGINSFYLHCINFLFDLLHGQYMTNELHNEHAIYFLDFLHNSCAIAPIFLQHELHQSILYELHVVHNPITYLHKMQILEARTNEASEARFQSYKFCIHWLGQQLKLPICLWSLMQGN